MDTVDMAWYQVELGHICVNVVRKKGGNKEDFCSIVTVIRKLVGVIIKHNQTSLDKLKYFLNATIFGEFFYIRNVGWKSIRRHN